MILSLDNINAHSPYEVRNSPNGDFVFGTNLGIHYLISFEEEAPLGGCATFDTSQFSKETINMPQTTMYKGFEACYINRLIDFAIILF